MSKGWTPKYVGDVGIPVEMLAEKYERAWPISDVMNALLDNGLLLTRFQEHPDPYWEEFPHLSEEERRRFPNTYSLFMQKR